MLGPAWHDQLAAMQLRKSLVQEYMLEVDVHRIAHYDSLPTGTLTPRSLSGMTISFAYPDTLNASLLKATMRVDKNISTNAQVCSMCMPFCAIQHVPNTVTCMM